MSGQEAGLNNELKQQIAAFQKEMLPKIPPAIREVLVRTTEDQVKSGITEKALKVGDKAPDFTLPNARGESGDAVTAPGQRTGGHCLLSRRVVTLLQPAVAGLSKSSGRDAGAGRLPDRHLAPNPG